MFQPQFLASLENAVIDACGGCLHVSFQHPLDS